MSREGNNYVKYNYVILATYSNLYKYLYQDILNFDNVKVYWDKEELLEGLPKLEKKLAKVYTSEKLNRVIHFPLKKVWYFKASKKIKFENENPLCFIWHHHFITEIDNGMVHFIKKVFPESKHLFFLTDPWRVNEGSIKKLIRAGIDNIAVFDINLAEKHGLWYLPLIYPDNKKDNTSAVEYDICFVGHDKGRESDLSAIAKLCKINNIKSAFYIAREKGRNESVGGGINYIENKMAYIDVVELVKRSNCILELGVKPDLSCSLRIQEAVIWNKKLITNNSNVARMPCCKDSEWIHYFEKPEDIDWDFVKRNEKVDYHYSGEYSAFKWLQAIENNLKNSM